MTDLDPRRALLFAKIDAHRAVLGLEVRYVRASMNPVSGLLGALGFDPTVAGAVVSGMRLASGGHPDAVHAWTAALPLLVGAVLRVLAGRHEEPSDANPPATA